MSTTKKTRASNFTKQDQLLLFDIIKDYIHIIESKKTDTIKQAEKQSTWKIITVKFNSNSVGKPRSTENLISCYRNVKSKIKKKHSEAKMLLIDPVQRGALINAIEENGKDWGKVASTSTSVAWSDPDICEKAFQELTKEAQKDENKIKMNMMKTGGGPQNKDNESNELALIKKIIEPQMEGLFTIYDSDASLMTQYQATLPKAERVQPIEAHFMDLSNNVEPANYTEEVGVKNKEINSISQVEKVQPSEAFSMEAIISPEPTRTTYKTPSKKSKLDILRKKKESALSCNESNKKRSINESFKQLSESKLELINLQKHILECEYRHKKKFMKLN